MTPHYSHGRNYHSLIVLHLAITESMGPREGMMDWKKGERERERPEERREKRNLERKNGKRNEGKEGDQNHEV